MGNLFACFGGHKKKGGAPRRPSLHGQPVCGPVRQVAPASEADGGASREDVRLDGSFVEVSRLISSDEPTQLDADGSKQPACNGFKKAGSNSPKKKVTFDMNVRTYESVPSCELPVEDMDDDVEEEEEEEQQQQQQEMQKKLLDVPLYPPNHRYENCASSDDEDGDEGSEEEEDEEDVFDCNEDDGCDDLVLEEESFSSYFSRQLDSNASLDLKPHLPGNQNARDRSNYVHAVLNPVENVAQWKEIKSKKTTPMHRMKENANNSPQSKIAIQITSYQKMQNCSVDSEQEVSVDASLSSWLTPPSSAKRSEGSYTPQRSNSRTTSLEERPILGALTVDDLKQANSQTPSPRKSPCRSPDDTPILGTVGRYWNHESCSSSSSCFNSATKGIPNTTSKYSEDKKVKWHSTPFEVRLERALNKGSLALGGYPNFSQAVF